MDRADTRRYPELRLFDGMSPTSPSSHAQVSLANPLKRLTLYKGQGTTMASATLAFHSAPNLPRVQEAGSAMYA